MGHTRPSALLKSEQGDSHENVRFDVAREAASLREPRSHRCGTSHSSRGHLSRVHSQVAWCQESQKNKEKVEWGLSQWENLGRGKVSPRA